MSWAGFGDGGGQMQEHRITGLHVRGAAPVQVVGVEPRRHVVGDRDGVEVTGQHTRDGRPKFVRASTASPLRTIS